MPQLAPRMSDQAHRTSYVHASRGLLCALAVLVVLLMGPGVGSAAPRPATRRGQPDRLRELEAGQPASEWDMAGAGDPTIQGFATDISVNQGADGPVQGRHRSPAATGSTSTAWATTAGTGARKVATSARSAALPQTSPPASPTPPPA